MREFILPAGSTGASVWTSQDRDDDEGNQEQDIHSDENPAEDFGCTVLEQEGHQHREERVEGGDGEDSLNSTIGRCECSVRQMRDLVEARAEQTERDDGREEL